MMRRGKDMQRVWIISRCAWTLYNFRLGVLHAAQQVGMQVSALGAGGDGFEESLQKAGIDFQHLPVDRKGLSPLADLRLFWHLCRRLRRERPKLVHLFTIKPVIYGGLATRLTKVPAIATITGLGYVFTSGRPSLRRVTEVLYKISLRKVQTVFFQNGEDRTYFVDRGIVRAQQARLVLGSGVDTQRFCPPPEHDFAQPIFLMVARLIREKGVLEYIEAAERLRKAWPKVRCLLVGAPDTRNPTAVSVDIIQHAVDAGSIEWSGAAKDVRPWLARSDVVVLPSYREGLPRSLLEAAAMARAIITTDTTGCRDVVTDGVNGLLVPVRDVDALTTAMLCFVEEPTLAKRFGEAGRERVLREFDERFVIEKTLAAYREAGISFEFTGNADEAVGLSGT